MTGGEIPSAEGLMSDSRLNVPERRWQQSFSFATALCLISLAFLALRSDVRDEGPDRQPGPDRLATLRYLPVQLPQPENAPFRVAGAWRIEVADDRFAGLSALAALPDRLLALTDSAVLVDLPQPGERAVARLRDLPDGPWYPTFRKYRDSEAMLVNRAGEVEWVTFENSHSLWAYDEDNFAAREPLPSADWPVNKGVEAMVEDPADGALLLLPEGGREVLRFFGEPEPERLPLTGATGGVADATRLPDGRMVVAVREVGLGLTNRLAWLRRDDRGYWLEPFATLPLGPFDNVEGLAAERLPGGGTRLWAVTDNDGWRRTLLIAVILPATTKAARERSRAALK